VKNLCLILFLLFLVGCLGNKKVTVVDPGLDDAPRIMGLDYRDFEKAATKAITDMLQSGAVNKPGGGRYVLAISRITNDTMQHIDTDQLIKKIRVELLRSGKVVTSTAIGLNGPEDPLVAKTRQLRQSQEVNQRTVAKKGQIIAPDLSLSGKIIQRNNRIDDDTQQVDYYFQLSLTDVNNGLALWEGETPIIKRGSSETVSW